MVQPLLPLGSEILVNTFTSGQQFTPVVTKLAGGGFVVVWTNGTFDVRAQVFGADGAKLGPEILVNSQDVGLQFDHKVQALSGGGFVVTWLDTQGDPDQAIKAQLFSATGVKLGGEILVNTTTAGDQVLPEIAQLSNGNFVISWFNGSLGLTVQLFSSAGAKIGGEIDVTLGGSSQFYSDPAPLSAGAFMMTWQAGDGIRARIFDSAGAPTGSEILVSSTTGSTQPRITGLDNGNLLVSYYAEPAGSTVSVRGQILTSAGAKVGGEILVDTGTGGAPPPLTLPGGGFVVAWTEGVQPNSVAKAQVYAADGSKVGGEIIVSTGTPTQVVSELILLPDGNFAIAWSDRRTTGGDTSNFAVRMQVFDSLGTKLGDEFLVNTATQNDQVGPHMAVQPDGTLIVVWDDFSMGVGGAGGDTSDFAVKAQFFALLPANVVTGTGGDDTLVGTPGRDQLQGLAGNDVLIGLAANDALIGGTGDDVFHVENSGDAVVEATGEGTDRVAAYVSFVLAGDAEVEILETITLSDTGAIDLTGNAFASRVVGNNGANRLFGGAAADVLIGLDGDDILSGDAGIDRMVGGTGNDTFYVDNSGDTVEELAGEGSDRVAAEISYILPAGASVERLDVRDLVGTNAVRLTGNEIVNTLIGNNGNNVLDGGGGNDLMIGLNGDDTYYVDSAGDNVHEEAAAGNDRVAASVSYQLTENQFIDRLDAITLTDTSPINLTGNRHSNTIVGNDGNNRLNGLDGVDLLVGAGGNDVLDGCAGADRMEGGFGNDRYLVDDPNDMIVERGGTPGLDVVDRVTASTSYTLPAGAEIEVFEPISIAGTTSLNFIGNEWSNAITGNAGANVLDGKFGTDVLAGLGGADTFQFSEAPGLNNVDRIEDFVPGVDRIALYTGAFPGLALGALPAGAFVVGTSAQDADDRIIYDNSTGALFFDADGSGSAAAVQFVTLAGTPAISSSDFVVI